MNARKDVRCPGCHLTMPAEAGAIRKGYYNTSPECMGVFEEVIGREFGNVVLFGQVHQLTVDAYAVQHVGGDHPDKSVDVHLCGLYLAWERGVRSPYVPRFLQSLANKIDAWPHFQPPREGAKKTVFDVAMTASVEEHIDQVREWSAGVWRSWRAHHDAIAKIVCEQLNLEEAASGLS